jgi:uncharacterized repeat protein (TIGR01451 family)
VASAPGSPAARAHPAAHAVESHAELALGSRALFPDVGLATADLSLFKFDSADPVSTGSSFSYTLTVANDGPDAATAVDVTDTLPAGVTPVSATPSQGSCLPPGATITCNLGTLAAVEAATVVISVTAPGTTGQITNSATVSTTATDPDPSNNTASEDTTVVDPGADLSVAKFAEPDPAATSAPLTYTLLVSNSGPDDATGVTVTDRSPWE